MEILFVVLDGHSTTFQEQPKLSSSIMFQMMILFQFLGKIHHAGRIEPFPKSLNISQGQFMLIFNQSLIEIAVIHDIQCFSDKSTHLIFNIIIDEIDYCQSHFIHFLFQKRTVEIEDKQNCALYVHVDQTFFDKRHSFFEAHLSMFNWNYGKHINCISGFYSCIFTQDFTFIYFPYSWIHVEILYVFVQKICQTMFQFPHSLNSYSLLF